MRTETALRYPLFDPSSPYSLIRSKVRPQDKMRGHIHWLAEQARDQHLPFPQSSALSESERRELAMALTRDVGEAGPEILVLDALPAKVEVVVTGVSEAPSSQGRSDKLVLANGASSPMTNRCDAALCLVREPDESHSIGLSLRFPPNVATIVGARPLSCRAFLFEPEVIKQFQRVLGSTYLDAFRPEIMTCNRDATRILASVPDLDGEWSPGDDFVRFSRLEISKCYELLPPRATPLQIVVLFHPADTVS